MPRGIEEHYPPAPTAPPLSRYSLLTVLDTARLGEAPWPIETAVAVISVDDMIPGWYRWDGRPWPNAEPLPDATAFERIAPVAFGRAGYDVQALVIIAAIDPRLAALRSRAYARLLVTGGAVLSRLEGAASDAGLSSRGNYAVDRSIGARLGVAADSVLPVGAVALGSR
ncbi:hypothetical protein JNW88_01765 [Micromonospora sp. ATA32]|nr:hypothetical protein [Micromonospora sp. ATA32]